MTNVNLNINQAKMAKRAHKKHALKKPNPQPQTPAPAMDPQRYAADQAQMLNTAQDARLAMQMQQFYMSVLGLDPQQASALSAAWQMTPRTANGDLANPGVITPTHFAPPISRQQQFYQAQVSPGYNNHPTVWPQMTTAEYFRYRPNWAGDQIL